MEKLNELLTTLEEVKIDAEKFYSKGNNQAGTRFRGGLQKLIVAARNLRKDVSSIRKEKSVAKKAEKLAKV